MWLANSIYISLWKTCSRLIICSADLLLAFLFSAQPNSTPQLTNLLNSFFWSHSSLFFWLFLFRFQNRDYFMCLFRWPKPDLLPWVTSQRQEIIPTLMCQSFFHLGISKWVRANLKGFILVSFVYLVKTNGPTEPENLGCLG